MLARALVELPALAKARLDAARLSHGEVTALGTPRRLAVIVRGLADRQPDLDERVVGPPVGAAFAADGTVTKAGLGFAAKNGVDPATLARRPRCRARRACTRWRPATSPGSRRRRAAGAA
jgi:glycyl-tRNA synthetase beta chain